MEVDVAVSVKWARSLAEGCTGTTAFGHVIGGCVARARLVQLTCFMAGNDARRGGGGGGFFCVVVGQ